MKIKEYRSQFIQELLSAYDAGEAESFYLILEEKHQLKGSIWLWIPS
jgi:release factor glutamine methyltransferase